jgi:hypothetical protein
MVSLLIINRGHTASGIASAPVHFRHLAAALKNGTFAAISKPARQEIIPTRRGRFYGFDVQYPFKKALLSWC